MHFKISFCLFSSLVTISNIYAWSLKGIESINKTIYNGSTGYDLTNENFCDAECLNAYCSLLTTGENPLFPSTDILEELKKEELEIGHSLYINAIKCTVKFQGDKELYIGIGALQHSFAVYEKPKNGTGVLVGIVVDSPAELERVPLPPLEEELPSEDEEPPEEQQDDDDYIYGVLP